MVISVSGLKKIGMCQLLIWSIVSISFSQLTPEEILNSAETITITPYVFSGLPDPVYQLTDPASVNLVTERVKMMLENIEALSCEDCWNQSSNLSYRGLRVTIGEGVNQVTLMVYDGGILLHLHPFDSRLWYLADSGREFERMIASLGARNNLRSEDANQVVFTEVVPQELYEPAIRCGFITIELVSDSFFVNFSSINAENMFLNRQSAHPAFSDLLIRRALEVSSSRIAFRLHAEYGIADISSDPDMGTIGITPSADISGLRDSLLQLYVEIIDSMQRNWNKIEFGDAKLLRADFYPQDFLVKTTEGGLALLSLAGYYIGAIDRILLFCIYTDQEKFDMDALRSFINGRTEIDKFRSAKYSAPGSSSSGSLFNLKGQAVRKTVSREPIKSAAAGLFLEPGGKEKNRILISR